MGKGFYSKMAWNNIKRNQKRFLPYFIAATIMISVYFMVLMIIFTPGLKDIPEHEALQVMFQIGFYVISIFLAIFMLYINSFLIKQRKKEMGLYGILGLEKRHVGRLMIWENIFINGSALVLGIVSGCVFGWLIFMMLLKSIKVTAHSYFAIPPKAIIITLVFFLILFMVISLFNLLQVRIANPIDLLKSDHQGEKKTRFLIPMTFIGLGALGYGYYIALTVVNPLEALNQFFIAVLLVIFASYVLFTSGSIFFLKLLKKNKKVYYQPDNFISIAGMFHRMKQNASGLASICILSSMVLVTVSTCVALYLGQEDSLKIRNKDDFKIEVSENTSDKQFEQLDEMFLSSAKDNNVRIENEYRYFSVETTLLKKNNQFTVPEGNIKFMMKTMQDTVSASCLILADFNRISGKQEALKDNECILLSNGDYSDVMELNFGNEEDILTYDVTKHLSDTIFTNGKNRKARDEIYIVVKDKQIIDQVIKQLNEKFNLNYKDNRSNKIILNLSGDQENCYQFGNDIWSNYGSITDAMGMSNIYSNRYSVYSINGGLLFMGAFFTILFLCATVLIIYFKQISEGYEDKSRFEMLQKVGMDDREVKKTINKQILIVFFLPLLGALLHISAASHMIIKLLEAFWLYNVQLTVLCLISSAAIFTIVYIIVYRLTARTYCRIVKW